MSGKQNQLAVESSASGGSPLRCATRSVQGAAFFMGPLLRAKAATSRGCVSLNDVDVSFVAHIFEDFRP
ncbi:MAG: hypothetical protein MUO27_01420, partial [Sedimentisphaerales bacterium]|nr:hypothetical protein [Sedimentisphaerales bacterium]